MTWACCALTTLANRMRTGFLKRAPLGAAPNAPSPRAISVAADDIDAPMMDSVLRPYADGGARITS
jgi:hypothetical protein